MKRIKSIVLSLIVFALLASALSACGVQSSPEGITKEFFKAVKAGDMEKGIECFTPAVQSEYKAAMALFGGFTGYDVSALWGGLVGIANSSDFSNTDFKIVGTKEVDKTHAEVTVDIYQDDKKVGDTTITCVKIDDTWYIEN